MQLRTEDAKICFKCLHRAAVQVVAKEHVILSTLQSSRRTAVDLI